MQLCAGRAPSLQHARELVGGGRGHLQRPLQVGVRAVGAEVSFSSTFFPKQAKESGVEEEETHTRKRTAFSQNKEGPRKRMLSNPPHPVSQTIAKVKDLVSESIRRATGT